MLKKLIVIFTLFIVKTGMMYAVEIDSMQIYTRSWDAKGICYFTLQDLVYDIKDVEQDPIGHGPSVTIYDTIYIRNIVNELNQEINNKEKQTIEFDFKTVAFIYYVNNQIDTLGFGHFSHFYYNSYFYKMDRIQLLDAITMKFPYLEKETFEIKKSFYYYFHDKRIRY